MILKLGMLKNSVCSMDCSLSTLVYFLAWSNLASKSLPGKGVGFVLILLFIVGHFGRDQ